ncbi:hypothetical protein ES705_48438 [subsurface metagenome]
MAQKSTNGKGSKADDTARAQAKALETAAKSGAGFAWIREDGAVCFGDECAVLKPTEQGKLGLTIKPSRCGEETGKVLLDYLIKTAGKGVQIEIPSEVDEAETRKSRA